MMFFRKSSNTAADHFLKLFTWHNIPTAQIPRLIPQLRYQDLESSKALLAALTPAIINQAADLFGVRRQWLDGTDDLVFFPFGSKGSPTALLAQLARAVKAAVSDGNTSHRAPLCVLSTTRQLNPNSPEQQLLVPVVVEPTGTEALPGEPVYRCHVFGNAYNWRLPQSRLELKAITWLAWHELGRVVPLYQVSPDDLQHIVGGLAFPSVVLHQSLITSPSLEDFISAPEHSRVAQEADELPQVLAYLDASGLRQRWHEAFTLPSKTATPEADASQETKAAPPAEPAKPDAGTPKTSGKRADADAQWAQVRLYAKAFKAAEPALNITEMARKLLTAPDLKLPSQQIDTIRRRIADLWTDPEAKKPGRRPKKSG